MTTCINFGTNCVDCPKGCIDKRRCVGKCNTCINNDCDNHPQATKTKKKCIYPAKDKVDGMCPCEICSIYNGTPLLCGACEFKRCTCAKWGLQMLNNGEESK